MVKRAAAICAMLLAVGCEQAMPPRHAVPVDERSGDLTGSFYLIADTQFDHTYGVASRARSSIADWLSPVAIHPPTLDLFADNLLQTALESNARRRRDAFEGAPTIFLGDGANTSCVDEYARFLREMSGTPWIGVLGNHDGFYMGNFTYARDAKGSPMETEDTWSGACVSVPRDPELAAMVPELATWHQADTTKLEAMENAICHKANVATHVSMNTLPKAVAIWMYLDSLHQRKIIDVDPLEPASWQRDTDTLDNPRADHWSVARAHDEACRADAGGRSYRFHAVGSLEGQRLDVDARFYANGDWKGYLVQDLARKDGTHYLLVDTADYSELPPSRADHTARMFLQSQAPGQRGEIGLDQYDDIERRLSAMPPYTRYFVFGHHSRQELGMLQGKAEARWHNLTKAPGFITYLSAHTHHPAATAAYVGREQWEVNVGSVTDYPMDRAGVRYTTHPRDWDVDLTVDVWQAPRPAPSMKECGVDARAYELRYGSRAQYATRALSVMAAVLRDLPDAEAGSLAARFAGFEGYRARLRADVSRVRALDEDGALEEKQALIAKLLDFNRAVLMRSPWVRAEEEACAAWASTVEWQKDHPDGQPDRLARSVPLCSSTTFRITPNSAVAPAE